MFHQTTVGMQSAHLEHDVGYIRPSMTFRWDGARGGETGQDDDWAVLLCAEHPPRTDLGGA